MIKFKSTKNKSKTFKMILACFFALIVIAGIAITYAIFTSLNQIDENVTFGTVDITTDNGTDNQIAELTLSHADGTLSTSAMPGDYIKANVRIKNVGTTACYYLLCFVCEDEMLSGSVNDDFYYSTTSSSTTKSNSITKAVGALEPNSNHTISLNLQIDIRLLEIPANGIKVNCVVYAIQQENITEAQAYNELQLLKFTDFPDADILTMYNENGTPNITNTSITSPIKIVYTDESKSKFYLDATSLNATSLKNDAGEELYFYSDVPYVGGEAQIASSSPILEMSSSSYGSKYETTDTSYIAALSQSEHNYDLTFDLNNKILYDVPATPLSLHPVFLKSNEDTYEKDVTPYLILSRTRTKTTSGEFNGHTHLKFVVIPNTITSLTEGTFVNCSNLKQVIFPTSGLTALGFQSFCRSGLVDLVIPKNITSLNNSTQYVGAFSHISTLKNVKFLADDMTISLASFYNCTNLENVILPKKLTKIGSRAFQLCSSLKSIDLPSTLTTIDTYAFTSSGLETVDLSKTKITSLTTAVFGGSKLEYVEFPSNLTSIGQMAFQECYNLKNVNLPSKLSSINSNAFAMCTSLETIDLPNSLYSLNTTAFYLSGLKGAIGIPKNTTIQGDSNGPFLECYGITSFYLKGAHSKYIEKNGIIYKLLDNGTYRMELIPNGITGTLYIDADVTEIRRFEDANCIYLEKFVVDPNNTVYATDDNGVLFSKTMKTLKCFPRGSKLTHYTVPNTVTHITFLTGMNLESLTIPSSVSYIQGCAFQGSEPIPNTLKRINSDIDGVFDLSQTKITSVTYKVMEYCINLKHLILPSTCTQIESGALRYSGCNEITTYRTSMVKILAGDYAKSGKLLENTGYVNNNGVISYTGITKLNVLTAELKALYEADSEWKVYTSLPNGAVGKLTVSVMS